MGEVYVRWYRSGGTGDAVGSITPVILIDHEGITRYGSRHIVGAIDLNIDSRLVVHEFPQSPPIFLFGPPKFSLRTHGGVIPPDVTETLLQL